MKGGVVNGEEARVGDGTEDMLMVKEEEYLDARLYKFIPNAVSLYALALADELFICGAGVYDVKWKSQFYLLMYTRSRFTEEHGDKGQKKVTNWQWGIRYDAASVCLSLG